MESTTPIDVTLGAPMRCAWSWLAALIVAVSLAPPAAGAEPGPESTDAKSSYDEATAAFGQRRYGEAAEKYEWSFALRPDAAALYNAAQSLRLAGSKARALELYRNYLRLYPDGANTEDARTHVAALKKALEDQPPPSETAQPSGGAAPSSPPPLSATPPPPAPPPPRPAATNVPLLAKPAADDGHKKPITQRTWFWVAVGAAAVLVGTVVLVGSGGEEYPVATFGTVRGN